MARVVAAIRRIPVPRAFCVRGGRVWVWLLAVCWGQAALAPHAHAYQHDSAVSKGCHERLTQEALRALREQLEAARVTTIDATTLSLQNDLPFGIDADMGDLAAISLLLGVRDNDLSGLGSLDTTSLAVLHGDDEGQQKHCLRRRLHDGREGSLAALAACRAYILDRTLLAITQGLDAAGLPDLGARAPLDVRLAFSNGTSLSLPVFFVAMGQALHALQDSFTHALRSDDHLRVKVLLNFVEVSDGSLDPARDGPAHIGAMDACNKLDSFREARFAAAREASRALLYAALEGPVEARQSQVEAVLDGVLGDEPGCDYDNDWCDARELSYVKQGCDCATGSERGPDDLSWLLLGVLAWWWRGRRPRWLAVGLVLYALSLASGAAAQEARPWSIYANTGGSLHNGAAHGALAVRRAHGPTWLLGLDAEHNPWWDLGARSIRAGTLNTYATVIWRRAISEHTSLRSTLHVGCSVLLVDLVGAPRGSVGPYLGTNLLGVDIALGETLRWVIDPADVSLPIPQVRGAPLSYHQYRFTTGLEWRL